MRRLAWRPKLRMAFSSGPAGMETVTVAGAPLAAGGVCALAVVAPGAAETMPPIIAAVVSQNQPRACLPKFMSFPLTRDLMPPAETGPVCLE